MADEREPTLNERTTPPEPADDRTLTHVGLSALPEPPTLTHAGLSALPETPTLTHAGLSALPEQPT